MDTFRARPEGKFPGVAGLFTECHSLELRGVAALKISLARLIVNTLTRLYRSVKMDCEDKDPRRMQPPGVADRHLGWATVKCYAIHKRIARATTCHPLICSNDRPPRPGSLVRLTVSAEVRP